MTTNKTLVAVLNDLAGLTARPVGHHKTCIECGRTFDLLDSSEADEWYYGHDCEGGN
jgi:hypothetical protein